MNNLNLATKPESSIPSLEEKKARKSAGKKGAPIDLQAVRIFKKTVTKIDELIQKSKKTGRSRIQARDLIELGIAKLSESDLQKLREETATTEDRFEERLKDFQKIRPSATREEFLEHLLKQANH